MQGRPVNGFVPVDRFRFGVDGETGASRPGATVFPLITGFCLSQISPSCRSFCGSRSSSIAPRLLSQRIWSRRGLVLQIGSTGPVTPPHGVLALLKRYEPAICGTVFIIALGAPRIVSRLSGLFDANNSCRRGQHDQQKPHGRLPDVAASPFRYKLLSSCFISSSRATRRDGLRRISRSCRGFFTSRNSNLTLSRLFEARRFQSRVRSEFVAVPGLSL